MRILGLVVVMSIGPGHAVHPVFGVVQITEEDGPRRTGLGAGRLVGIFLDLFLTLLVGLVPGQLVAMEAEAALFDDTAHARRDIGTEVFFHALGPDRIPPIEIARMVGAGSHAVATAETTGVDLADDAGLLAVVGGRSRADRYTRGVALVLAGAMLARTWKVDHLRIWKFLPLVTLYTFIQVMLKRLLVSSFLKDTLFSEKQATMQAPHPVHLSRSMTMP